MSKKFTVYLKDDEAKRLEAETSAQASPGKVIKDRLLDSWHKEDTAPVLPKVIQTNSIFTEDGDEIKRHVSDIDVAILSEGIANPEEPKATESTAEPKARLSFFSPDHSRVLLTINMKKEQRKRQFVRAEIVKESRVPGNIVDEVLKSLSAEGRIKKVDYNAYEWTLFIPGSEERAARLEPITEYLKQVNASNPNLS